MWESEIGGTVVPESEHWTSGSGHGYFPTNFDDLDIKITRFQINEVEEYHVITFANLLIGSRREMIIFDLGLIVAIRSGFVTGGSLYPCKGRGLNILTMQPIRSYLGHVTGYQPIRDQYYLVEEFPVLVIPRVGWCRIHGYSVKQNWVSLCVVVRLQ